jgi:flagellar biosynthesis anti-sigma factor FlgM
MKIDEAYRDIGLLNSQGESQVKKQTEVQPEPAKKEESPDKVETQVDLSRTSVEFSKVSESLDKPSPERAAKIEALKKQVQEGTYHVDAVKIAEKMIEDSLEDIT